MSHNSDDICRTFCIRPEVIAQVREQMPSDDEFQALADTFKVLGDFNRLRILQALNTAELCVCDLSELLGLSQSATSHQLRLLRASQLVRYRREGKNVYYTLDDEHVRTLIETALAHVQEPGTCKGEQP